MVKRKIKKFKNPSAEQMRFADKFSTFLQKTAKKMEDTYYDFEYEGMKLGGLEDKDIKRIIRNVYEFARRINPDLEMQIP